MNEEILDLFLDKLNLDTAEFQDYIEEFRAISSNKVCPRSAINLSWGIFMFYVYSLINEKITIKSFVESFNQKNQKNKTYASSVYELSNFSDEEIINELYQEAFFTDENIRKIFKILKDKRNMSSHINLIKHDQGKYESYLKEIMDLVDLINKHLKREGLLFDHLEFSKIHGEKDLEEYITRLSFREKMNLFDFISEFLENVSKIYIENQILKSLEQEYEENKKYFYSLKEIYDSLLKKEEKSDFVNRLIFKLNLFERNPYLSLLLQTINNLEDAANLMSKEAKRNFIRILVNKYKENSDFYTESTDVENLIFYFSLMEEGDLTLLISISLDKYEHTYYSYQGKNAFYKLVKKNKIKFISTNPPQRFREIFSEALS